MRSIKDFIIRNKFLSFVFVAYIALFIYRLPMGILALKNSVYYFKEMLIIMPVIMLLTALLEAWVEKDAIEKNLGANAGFKGQFFSFLLGSFSAGPIYAAFPVCITLLKKGASIANIVILLSTWAVVKVPMLANEAKFLNLKFMLIRWVLTTISIFIIGAITSKFVKRDTVLLLHNAENTEELPNISINSNYCVGCGICAKIAPENFSMQNGKAIVIDTSKTETVLKASQKCPAKAISIK